MTRTRIFPYLTTRLILTGLAAVTVTLALLPGGARASSAGTWYGYVVTGSTYQSISADWKISGRSPFWLRL